MLKQNSDHDQSLAPNRKTTERRNSVSFDKIAKITGALMLCVVSSAITVLAMLSLNLISLNAGETITQNREKIVLQEGEIVSDVYKKVNASTVAITTEQLSNSRFFESAVQQGAGSGIVISSDGYVMTNKHVVPEGTNDVNITTADGQEYTDVKVVGRDPFNDIAFLKIQNVNNLTAAKIGDSSKIEIGQKVIAIGNALGEFSNSVTSGIISGKGRLVQAADSSGTSSERLENLFQTDAAINSGNSGGPLLNLQGEIIGINTAIAEQSEGIGFAIPINDAKGMIKTVLEKGKVIKAYLGVRYITLTPAVASQLDLPIKQGAYVGSGSDDSAVMQNSPAAKAGIKSGDIIQKVNNSEINETTTLASLLGSYAPGDKITLTIWRSGKTQTVDVTLEAYPN